MNVLARGCLHYASIRCVKRSRHNVLLTPSRSPLVSFSLNWSYYLQRKRAKPQTAAAARRQRLGLLSSCEDFLEDLLVEGGEDQLVVVDQAAEANGELLQFLADWEQTAGQRRRGIVLTGLQGGQEVALNTGVWEEAKKTTGSQREIEGAGSQRSRTSTFLPISLRTVLPGWAMAQTCPLRASLRSAENGEKPCWLTQRLTSTHSFSPMVAKASSGLKDLWPGEKGSPLSSAVISRIHDVNIVGQSAAISPANVFIYHHLQDIKRKMSP